MPLPKLGSFWGCSVGYPFQSSSIWAAFPALNRGLPAKCVCVCMNVYMHQCGGGMGRGEAVKAAAQ